MASTAAAGCASVEARVWTTVCCWSSKPPASAGCGRCWSGRGSTAGTSQRVRGVRVASARRVEVSSEEDVLVDCDGEVIGRLPAVYEIVPGAITVCA